jgi:prophage DNA circulation protein
MSDSLGTILPASWRGQIFGVYGVSNRFGRRTALHEYPYKDSVWIEDLGSGRKAFGFRGFITGPLAAIQHAALALAMDKKGTGTLTHPSLGIFTGVVVSFSSRQSVEFINGFDLEFEFVESVEPTFPDSTASTTSGVNLGALNIFSLAGTAFGTALGVAGVALGLVTAAPAVIGQIMALPASLASDAAAIANSATSIGDAFGPYASQATVNVTATDAATSRAALSACVATAIASGASGDPAQIQAAVSAVPAAVQAAATDPADQVRLLLPLTASVPVLVTAGDAIGQAQASVAAAISALFRRAALAAIATASAASLPTSYDDAMALMGQVTSALDAEITLAGDAADAADADVMAGLIALRAAVVADLTARGASLAPLRTVSFAAPMPALAVAQQLYRDGTRADELIRRVHPWHPAFLSGPLTVLAA